MTRCSHACTPHHTRSQAELAESVVDSILCDPLVLKLCNLNDGQQATPRDRAPSSSSSGQVARWGCLFVGPLRRCCTCHVCRGWGCMHARPCACPPTAAPSLRLPVPCCALP